jgi:chlorite dismutase
MSQTLESQTDVQERGANQQVLDRRLFMQLQVFGGCLDSGKLASTLEQRHTQAVLYQDVNDPRGVGLLTMHEDPVFFVTTLRELVNTDPFRSLSQKLEFTMMGRSYSSGYEPDLEDWLLYKPRRTVLNPSWGWAIWYPLRRSGTFAKLTLQGAF